MRRTPVIAACATVLAILCLPAAAEPAPPNPILDRAVEAAREVPAADASMALMRRIIAAALNAGEPDYAARLAKESVPLARKCTVPDRQLHDLAVLCLQNGLPEVAHEIAGLMRVPKTRAEFALAVGELACKRGETAAALEAAAQGAEAARQTDEPGTSADLLLRAAELALDAGGPEQATALLPAVEKSAAAVEDAFQADSLRARRALVLVRAGLTEKALEAAGSITDANTRARTFVRIVALWPDAAQPVEDIPAWADALAAAQTLPPQQSLLTIAEVAGEIAGHGQTDAALRVARATEAVALQRKPEEGRGPALSVIASLYGQLGLWAEAARLAEANDDPYNECKFAAENALALAAGGDLEGAARAIDSLDPAHVRYVGLVASEKLAAVYVEARPNLTPAAVAKSPSDDFRDTLAAALAKHAAQQGAWDAASEYLALAKAPRTRSVGGAAAATAGLEAATAERIADAARFAREAVSTAGEEQQLDVLQALAGAYLRVPDPKAVDDVIGEVRRSIGHWTWDAAEARGLTAIAIIEQRLGRPDKAVRDVTDAVAAAYRIHCSGCRFEALKSMFRDLRLLASVDLLDAAFASMPHPPDQMDRVVETVDAMPDLAPADKARLLRHALTGALAYREGQEAVEALCRTAEAYGRAGAQPGEAERALIANPPEQARLSVAAMRTQPMAGAPPSSETSAAQIAFFARPGCNECAQVELLLQRLAGELSYLKISRYTLGEYEPDLRNKALCLALGVPDYQHLVGPAVFGYDRALIGDEITRESLLALIARTRGQPDPSVYFYNEPFIGQAKRGVRHQYESLGLLAVLGAGLADGFNPCAFTVIIFFVSYLSYLGRSRRQIAWAGSVFTFAVFATYFSVGFGMKELVSLGERYSSAFSTGLYAVTAALVLVAAVLSFRDAALCLRGQVKDLALTLPDALKSRIRLSISQRARLGLTIGATAVLGAVVALIELPCTGQMYLPTIIFARQHLPEYYWGPIGWLLLYNLCFILPLVVVFVAVFYGLTSERLTALFRRHMAGSKFALGGVFSLLFVLMAYQVARKVGLIG